MKLYYAPGACSFVPHTMLETAGAAFEPEWVRLHKNEQNSESYRSINPRGQVPVLVDGDVKVTQIIAIASYLDQKFPQCGFFPADPLERVRYLELLAWLNSTVHPTFTHIFMPYKFTDNPAIHGDLQSCNTRLYRGMLEELEQAVARFTGPDRPYIGGQHFGPADAYALTVLRWGSIAGIDPQVFPATWQHVQRVAALPAVARVIERERLKLNLYSQTAG